MGTSVTAVCNRALTKLGAARITDISEDTRGARALISCFDQVRDHLLRSYRWAFSIKRTSLAASATTPAFGFAYQYVLPSDFLQLDQVNNEFPLVGQDSYISTELVDYAIEGGMLLANFAPPLMFRYRARITDSTLWDANFAEVFACKLAWELCEELTQSDNKRQLAMQEFKVAVSMAFKANAIQRLPTPLQDNGWMLSRL